MKTVELPVEEVGMTAFADFYAGLENTASQSAVVSAAVGQSPEAPEEARLESCRSMLPFQSRARGAGQPRGSAINRAPDRRSRR